MRSQGRLYAFDTHDRRLANLKPRLARSGLSNVHPQVLAHERDAKVKRLAGKIDRVLVDAPCTGFGTLRRNPDLKWRQPESARRRAHGEAAVDPRRRGNAREARRPARLRDVQRAARRERGDRRRISRRAIPRSRAATPRPSLARAGIALDTGPDAQALSASHGCDGFFAAILTHRVATRPAAASAQRIPVDFPRVRTRSISRRIAAALESPSGLDRARHRRRLLRRRLDARSPACASTSRVGRRSRAPEPGQRQPAAAAARDARAAR